MELYGFKDKETAERLRDFAGQKGKLPNSGIPQPLLRGKIAADPDTPFRQTVRVNEAYDDAVAGTPIAAIVSHDPSTVHLIAQDDHTLNTGDYPDHRLGIEQGTISFLMRDKIEDGDGISIKTANGGFAEALVYQVHAGHKYAMLDVAGGQNAAKYLISVPHGPYRIIAKRNIEPWTGPPSQTPYPRFVMATIKEQVSNRDIGAYNCRIVAHPTDSDRFMIVNGSIAGAGAFDGRFHLSELSGMTKSNYVQGSIYPLYLIDLRIVAVVGRQNPVTHTVVSTAGVNLTFNIFPAASIALQIIGTKAGGVQEVLRTIELFVPATMTMNTPTSTGNPSQLFPIHICAAFIEQYGAVHFELTKVGEPSVSGFGGQNGDVIIHRFGDCGALKDNLPRSQGLTLPVFEQPNEPDPLNPLNTMFFDEGNFGTMNLIFNLGV